MPAASPKPMNNWAWRWKARKPGTRAHIQATRHRGTLLRLQGRSQEALPWLEQAIAESATRPFDRNEHATGLVELGLAQLELGNFTAAQATFSSALTELDAIQQRAHDTDARGPADRHGAGAHARQ